MEAAHAYYKNEFDPQQFIIGTQHVVIDYGNSQVSVTKSLIIRNSKTPLWLTNALVVAVFLVLLSFIIRQISQEALNHRKFCWWVVFMEERDCLIIAGCMHLIMIAGQLTTTRR